MIKIDLTVKQAEELQKAVDYHMELCQEYLNWENYSDGEEEMPEIFNAVDMYCGCHVCETREHLTATFNYLRDAGIVDIAVE